jgi:hypothetical protein
VNDHFLVMALFGLFVSAVFAVLMRDDPRAQLRLGGWMFAAFIGSGLLLGWLMYPLPL